MNSDAPIPADLEAHHAMWFAALSLMIDDARAHLAGRKDPRGTLQAAYRDVTTCGPMLAHLCKFCALDPQFVRAQFLASLEPGRRGAA